MRRAQHLCYYTVHGETYDEKGRDWGWWLSSEHLLEQDARQAAALLVADGSGARVQRVWR